MDWRNQIAHLIHTFPTRCNFTLRVKRKRSIAHQRYDGRLSERTTERDGKGSHAYKARRREATNMPQKTRKTNTEIKHDVLELHALNMVLFSHLSEIFGNPILFSNDIRIPFKLVLALGSLSHCRHNTGTARTLLGVYTP